MKSAHYMANTTWLCTAAWAFTLGHWFLGLVGIGMALIEGHLWGLYSD